MTAEALHYDAVSFRYPDADTQALDGVDATIGEGTFALAAGPTGAGKSTFLRAANGLVPHFTGGTFAGRVLAGGRDTLAFPCLAGTFDGRPTACDTTRLDVHFSPASTRFSRVAPTT